MPAAETPKPNGQNILRGIGLIVVIVLIFKFCGDDTPAAPKVLTRAEKIEAQFSSLDGSHKQLKTYIKERLNDPSSFEHVQTKYIDNGASLGLVMKYRALNNYGMSILSTVVASANTETGAVSDVEQID